MKKIIFTAFISSLFIVVSAQNANTDTTKKNKNIGGIVNNGRSIAKAKFDSSKQNINVAYQQKKNNIRDSLKNKIDRLNPFHHKAPVINANPIASQQPTVPAPNQTPVNPASVTNQTPINPASPPTVVSNTGTQSFFGVNLSITSCVGNASTQSVTVSFIVSNPTDKVDQYIRIGPAYGWGNLPPAVDVQGNQLGFDGIQLGNKSGRSSAETEIFTGTNLKGMVIYNNVLPSSASISVLNFPISIRNWAGRAATTNGTVTFRNVAITWQ